ncbi:alpha/beta hydrolase [Nocardioides humi]|uniref:Alpha/beta hydrolase n=2 Tax=Nocardioides humi TaxID=449461 RepID=A0ABN2BSF1_9ACTN|nr:alpha/beta hydrolase [Nocardioides humi]
MDPDAQALLTMMAERGAPVHELTPSAAREQQRLRTSWANGTPERITEVGDRTVPGSDGPIGIRVYRPRATDDALPVLAFFHGGGWVTCDLDSHEVLCRALANRGDCVVVSVDYPLAPEHPFPAGLEACWSVVTWLSENASELGADSRRIAVGGDSAGGNLAAVVALRARDAGLRLALQLLIYPSTDYRLDTPPDEQTASEYGLTLDGLRFYYGHYLTDPADVLNPEVSPFRAPDLTGSAPAYVVSCELDPLRPEIEGYAARLVEAGVPVTSRRYLGQIHGFVRATAVIKDSWVALDEMGHALRAAFAHPALNAARSETFA